MNPSPRLCGFVIPSGRSTFRADEVADLLAVTKPHVLNLIKSRELAASGGTSSCPRIPVASLVDFVARRSTAI